jgi:hypothetical protein
MPAKVSSNIPREILLSVDVTSNAGNSDDNILIQEDDALAACPRRLQVKHIYCITLEPEGLTPSGSRNTGTNEGFVPRIASGGKPDIEPDISQ